MPEYKLTYFNGRGRGEIIRLIFVVAGVDYEDVRIEPIPEEFQKVKPSTVFGQLPTFEFGGRKYCQSLAIARFLARKYHLAGKTELEEFRADMIIDCMDDIIKQISEFTFHEDDPTKKAAKMKKLLESDLPSYLNNLEKILKENNNGDGYFVGNDLTWADLTLSTLSSFFGLCGAKFGDHPKLEALLKRVEAQPKVAAWIAKRPATPF